MVHIHTLFFILIILIFQTIPFAASLNFSFHSFNPKDFVRINCERDATIANEAIQLTKNLRDVSLETSIGRATYFKPIQLWDKASRNLTDFTTHFSFVINSMKNTSYGDGFAFFLAPNGTTTPVNAKEGGTFGLTKDDQPLNTTVNRFVAVEFDIFANIYPYSVHLWDPGDYEHVGIDINSVQSNATVEWSVGNSITEGGTNEALCGRKPIDPNAEESRIRLVEWVWNLYGMGKLVEAADPKLSGEFDEQEMQWLMIVGLWCVHPDSTLRPSISQAIHVLNLQAPLPTLPGNMPVATYSTPVNMPLASVSLASGVTVSSSSQTHSSGYSNNTDSSSFSISSPPYSASATLLHTR